MSGGSADASRLAAATPGGQLEQRSIRAQLLVALCLGGALFGVVRLAVSVSPSDTELAAIVLARGGTVDARRALHALVAREVQRNRKIDGLDEVIPRLAPADRAFLAEFRPDLLRRGRGEPR